jgi:hypothetical protein
MSSETLPFQPPHKLNALEKQFQDQLSTKEKELHALASKMLGSSYFVGKTHGYRAWDANQKKSNPNTQPPKAK